MNRLHPLIPMFVLMVAAFFIAGVSAAHAQQAAQTAAINPETRDEAPVGILAETEGAVAIAEGDKAVIPVPGRQIYIGDIIETGAAGRILILFIDDTELTLGENSRLVIDDYVFDPDDTTVNKGRFSILRGTFLFVSGLLGKTAKPDVQVMTGYGSIGIRGTKFWGGVLDDEFNVFVEQGLVDFATERGRVSVRDGEGTRVASRRNIPTRAQKWGEAKIARTKETVGLKNAAAVQARIATLKQQHGGMRALHKEAIYGRLKLKREQIEQNREQQIRQRQEKLREHRPTPEQIDKMKESAIERDRAAKEKQGERDRAFQGGADNAPEFEKREREHLDNAPHGPQPQKPPAGRPPPPARR